MLQEVGAMVRLLPILKPTPLAADQVHERVAHGTEAAAEIARELFRSEHRDRAQNSVVCPTVIFEQQANVILRHGASLAWSSLTHEPQFVRAHLAAIYSSKSSPQSRANRELAHSPRVRPRGNHTPHVCGCSPASPVECRGRQYAFLWWCGLPGIRFPAER